MSVRVSVGPLFSSIISLLRAISCLQGRFCDEKINYCGGVRVLISGAPVSAAPVTDPGSQDKAILYSFIGAMGPSDLRGGFTWTDEAL